MGAVNARISADKARTHLEAIDEITEEDAPEQMELAFERPFNDVVTKDAIRGVKTIIKELARLGVDALIIKHVMELASGDNLIIAEAFALIDEQIERSAPD